MMNRESRRPRQSWTGWLFASPWAIGFSLFLAYPFAATLYWSFCQYDLLRPPTFIGLDHYERLAGELISGGRFAQALWNTTYYALASVPTSIALGILLAVMLSWPVPGRSLFRSVIFMPSVVPVVAASIVWMWLLDPESGQVNYLLSSLGLGSYNWFQGVEEGLWLPAWWSGQGGWGSKDGLALMGIWGIGNVMVIYLAAIGDIPVHLYEAAEMDGAGRWSRFLHVTIPMLSPVIFFNLVMGLIQSVQAFTQVYLVSEGTGGPAGASLVLSLHLFLSAFQDLDMGYASAMAWILFVILVTITVILFRSSRNWVHYQGLAR